MLGIITRNKFLNRATVLAVLIFCSFGASDAFAQNCEGPGGLTIDCPASGTSSGNGGSIFNRTSAGWTSTGWGNGGGSGGSGGLFGSGFYAGKGAVGISGPGGSIRFGKNVISGGTGANGGQGFGGYNDQINAAACTVLGIPMGSFGALVMSFAGIIAIVSGALGAYKMALSTIVVGAGSWILFPIVSMFFPVNCGF